MFLLSSDTPLSRCPAKVQSWWVEIHPSKGYVNRDPDSICPFSFCLFACTFSHFGEAHPRLSSSACSVFHLELKTELVQEISKLTVSMKSWEVKTNFPPILAQIAWSPLVFSAQVVFRFLFTELQSSGFPFKVLASSGSKIYNIDQAGKQKAASTKASTLKVIPGDFGKARPLFCRPQDGSPILLSQILSHTSP